MPGRVVEVEVYVDGARIVVAAGRTLPGLMIRRWSGRGSPVWTGLPALLQLRWSTVAIRISWLPPPSANEAKRCQRKMAGSCVCPTKRIASSNASKFSSAIGARYIPRPAHGWRWVTNAGSIGRMHGHEGQPVKIDPVFPLNVRASIAQHGAPGWIVVDVDASHVQHRPIMVAHDTERHVRTSADTLVGLRTVARDVANLSGVSYRLSASP